MNLPLVDKFTALVLKTDSCWNWLGPRAKNGRPQFIIANRQQIAARFAYELFRGEVHSNLQVLHDCDNMDCVNPDHLHLGTHQQNMAEAKQRNRFARGTDHGNAKLTPEKVLEIVALYKTGNFTQQAIGRKFGLKGHSAVNAILRGRDWEHVPRELFPIPIDQNRIRFKNQFKQTTQAFPIGKFSADQVFSIWKQHAETNISQVLLAKAHGVSKGSMYYIINSIFPEKRERFLKQNKK